MYRTSELRKYQMFAISDWSGGMYATPSIQGSRNGSISIGTWAALLKFGREGYIKWTKHILDQAKKAKNEIKKIPELQMLNDDVVSKFLLNFRVLLFQLHLIDLTQLLLQIICTISFIGHLTRLNIHSLSIIA